MARTVAEIIDALGVAALSREFGHRNDSTVSSWRLRGSIRHEYWPTILAFAAKQGLSLSAEDLLAAHHDASAFDHDRSPESDPSTTGDGS